MTKSFTVELAYGATVIAEQLASFPISIGNELANDIQGLSLDLFVADWMSAVCTGRPGKLVLGIRVVEVGRDT